MTLAKQLFDHRPVGVEAFRLTVGRKGPALVRALVPVEPEPAQRVVDLLLAVGAEACAVGVLDPQDERAALLPDEREVEQRHVRRADVRITGRRGGDPKPHAHLATTVLVRDPMPSISTVTVSPICIGPIPAGVPVRMTSPGSSVMQAVM